MYLDKKAILKNIRKYNGKHPCEEVHGFPLNEHYDALVIAPVWRPDMIGTDEDIMIEQCTQRVYTSTFILENNKQKKIAWIQCAAGKSNLLDDLMLCLEMNVGKLFFAGSVGGLTEEFYVGDLCTPEKIIHPCISPEMYLEKKLFDIPMTLPTLTIKQENIDAISNATRNISDKLLKTGTVFCVDSVSLEYSHLKEIVSTGANLIEMETGTFVRLAEFFKLPYHILLVVSDNSASGQPLLVDDEKKMEGYKKTRAIIPQLVFQMLD